MFQLTRSAYFVAEGHAFAVRSDIPVATLAAEPLLLSEETRAPEFNQFVIELCRSVGVIPICTRRPSTASWPRPTWVAQRAVRALRTILVRADPCWDRLEAHWWPPVALSLVGAMAGGDCSDQVGSFVGSARTLSEQHGWLYPPLAG